MNERIISLFMIKNSCIFCCITNDVCLHSVKKDCISREERVVHFGTHIKMEAIAFLMFFYPDRRQPNGFVRLEFRRLYNDDANTFKLFFMSNKLQKEQQTPTKCLTIISDPALTAKCNGVLWEESWILELTLADTPIRNNTVSTSTF